RDLAGSLDWILLTACALIAAFGLLMVYSASRNRVDDQYYFVTRQAVALMLGIGVFIGLLRVDYRKFRDFSMLAYVLVVAALFFVLTPIGSATGGATSWYELPFNFQLQPAELAKFGLIVALAGYVNEHRGDIDPWRLTVIMALALVPLGLVQLQPDLGTNMVLMAIVIGLLAVAGVRGRYLLILAALAITAIYAVIAVGVLQEYQLDRLAVFQDTANATQGSAYNVRQATAALGAGGLFGQGLFQGSQTRLGFVPEQHTDFIFTAVGEELGFVGAGALIGLFCIVLWRTWRIAQLARDYYGTLVCAGVLAMFTFMIFENIGMTLNIMPVTGIPLPFMSYGGSAMITCCACMGLVQNVYANRFN
ncbi:MAG: rod shape-determining protein RodA, partial [Dehalococcoidia bacterium]